jgi:hypothetical protein
MKTLLLAATSAALLGAASAQAQLAAIELWLDGSGYPW